MRVGIISFEAALDARRLRGVFTTTRYLKRNLENTGLDVDLLVYSTERLNYPTDFDIVRHCRNLHDLSTLKETYDFIIYFTPGISIEKYDETDPDRYLDVVNAVGLPFTTIYHSEEYKKHQPYRKNFISHPDCKFLIFISEGFEELYPEDLEIQPNYVIASMMPPLNDLEYIVDKSKSDSVIITSAWTNYKRNSEYFEMVGDFIERGISPYSAGAPSSNFYMNDILDGIISQVDLVYDEESQSDDLSISRYRDYTVMMARLKQEIPYGRSEYKTMPKVVGAILHDRSGHCWRDYGAYYPDQISEMLSDKKFHWHVAYYQINKKVVPRLETVTMEAFNEGCLPVLCRETSPEWITSDSALRFSKLDYREHLDTLSSMSETERLERICRLYYLIYNNVYKGVFEGLRDEILKCVSQ